MAAPPLSRVELTATSLADDVGFVGLADLSRLVNGRGADYRLIGGHMVTVLVARWRLGVDLYRETGDTDLGVPPAVVVDHRLIERLKALDYAAIAGNRFARQLADVPIERPARGGEPPRAIIDVLVPAYTSRVRQDRHIGSDLVTNEVPGLAFALTRSPVTVQLGLRRLNGDFLDVELSIADEVSALVLKAMATTVRSKGTDILDIWRCLEIGLAAGLTPLDFTQGDPATASRIVRSLFADRHGEGMKALVAEEHLSSRAADERFTRIGALMARIFGS